MSEQDTQPLGLTMGDLQVMAQIISASSTRGAFKAEEMAVIGTTFNKIVAILEAEKANNAEVAEQNVDTEEQE